LASARSASWLAYSIHPRSLTPIWSWMHGCTKPMPTHAHPCPLMNNNIAPMPTQNPWVWVGMGMGTRCRAHVYIHNTYYYCSRWKCKFLHLTKWALNQVVIFFTPKVSCQCCMFHTTSYKTHIFHLKMTNGQPQNIMNFTNHKQLTSMWLRFIECASPSKQPFIENACKQQTTNNMVAWVGSWL
jgi:hypothetical protein